MTVRFSNELGGRVLQCLESELIVWLTTVDSKGAPQPRPVWFLWNGSTVLIYSKPDAYKVRHVRRSSKVSLNFNTDRDADQYAVLTGEARIDPDAPRSDRLPLLPGEVPRGDRPIGYDPGEPGSGLLDSHQGKPEAPPWPVTGAAIATVTRTDRRQLSVP